MPSLLCKCISWPGWSHTH